MIWPLLIQRGNLYTLGHDPSSQSLFSMFVNIISGEAKMFTNIEMVWDFGLGPVCQAKYQHTNCDGGRGRIQILFGTCEWCRMKTSECWSTLPWHAFLFNLLAQKSQMMSWRQTITSHNIIWHDSEFAQANPSATLKMQLDVANEPHLSQQKYFTHSLTWIFLRV